MTVSACHSEARRLYLQMADAADRRDLDGADAKVARSQIAEFVVECASEGAWIDALPGAPVSAPTAGVSILSFAAMGNSGAAMATIVPGVLVADVASTQSRDEIERHLSQAIETALYFESDVALEQLVDRFVEPPVRAERLASVLPWVSATTNAGLRNLAFVARHLVSGTSLHPALLRYVQRSAAGGDLRSLQCIASVSQAATAEIQRVLSAQSDPSVRPAVSRWLEEPWVPGEISGACAGGATLTEGGA